MRQIFRTALVLTALLLIACASVAVKSFSVNNLTQCQDTGACELFLELTVDGRSFQPSRDYPSASADDQIDIDWGDGSTYSATARACVDESVCRFVNGGLLLFKNYELGSGYFTSVHLNGENFKNLQGDTAFGTFTAREDTRFVSFNTGLADTQVDYYSGRKELMIENLIDLDADVICLQEVWKGKDMQLIRDGLAQKFPYSYAEMQDTSPFKWAWGHNGLQILSRYPIKNETFKETLKKA